jgi:hypothetical protein
MVDLPEPLRPTMATVDPAGTSKLTFSRIVLEHLERASPVSRYCSRVAADSGQYVRTAFDPKRSLWTPARYFYPTPETDI